ncbi:hypothetical protein WDU94_008154 [Cyamophila willieti]
MMPIPCLPCCIAIGSLATLAIIGSYAFARYSCRKPNVQRSSSCRRKSQKGSKLKKKPSVKDCKASIHSIETRVTFGKKGKNSNRENECEEHVEKQTEYDGYNQQDTTRRQRYKECNDSIEQLERRMENYRRNQSRSPDQQWGKHSHNNYYIIYLEEEESRNN